MMKKELIEILSNSGVTLAACGTGGNSTSSASEDTEKGWPEEITLVQMPNENNPNAASLHTQLREHLSEELRN